MSDKKIRTFSIFLLLGIATLFVPVTALQNSIANAQEYYNEEYEENGYYNQEYDPYKDDKNKNAPIVNVEKRLFICNNATASPDNFACTTPAAFLYPAGIDSGEYMPCNDEICPFIDESDFSAQIFKDVAIIRGLSPEGTPVNLDKFHYMVTEGEIDKNTNDYCSAVGFDHAYSFDKLIDSTSVFYDICVNYVGDCEGTIYSGEVKTCTIENYIFFGEVVPFEPDGNTADTSSTQQTSNQAIQSQPNILRDIFSD